MTTETRKTHTPSIDSQGRVLIPAEIRRERGWEPGQRLYIREVEGRVTLMTFEEITQYVRSLADQYLPGGVSLVDELIAERREAAARGD